MAQEQCFDKAFPQEVKMSRRIEKQFVSLVVGLVLLTAVLFFVREGQARIGQVAIQILTVLLNLLFLWQYRYLVKVRSRLFGQPWSWYMHYHFLAGLAVIASLASVFDYTKLAVPAGGICLAFLIFWGEETTYLVNDYYEMQGKWYKERDELRRKEVLSFTNARDFSSEAYGTQVADALYNAGKSIDLVEKNLRLLLFLVHEGQSVKAKVRLVALQDIVPGCSKFEGDADGCRSSQVSDLINEALKIAIMKYDFACGLAQFRQRLIAARDARDPVSQGSPYPEFASSDGFSFSIAVEGKQIWFSWEGANFITCSGKSSFYIVLWQEGMPPIYCQNWDMAELNLLAWLYPVPGHPGASQTA